METVKEAISAGMKRIDVNMLSALTSKSKVNARAEEQLAIAQKAREIYDSLPEKLENVANSGSNNYYILIENVSLNVSFPGKFFLDVCKQIAEWCRQDGLEVEYPLSVEVPEFGRSMGLSRWPDAKTYNENCLKISW